MLLMSNPTDHVATYCEMKWNNTYVTIFVVFIRVQVCFASSVNLIYCMMMTDRIQDSSCPGLYGKLFSEWTSVLDGTDVTLQIQIISPWVHKGILL